MLLNAESHGLTRIQPEPYTCECGATLTPEVLDEGDESKASWPNCKSWRNGGQKKCPECDEYPSFDREQRIRARGYEPTPKDEIKNITQNQREEALEEHDRQCIACRDTAEYVKRMVPPRYGGSRELKNLAPLCAHHYEDVGHMFADLLQPAGWYQIHGISWREVAESMRDQYTDQGADSFVETLDELLDRGQPENPYPYIDA
ncbi:hypothetical protein GCM10009647_015510 [Streptomyces sanglieri]